MKELKRDIITMLIVMMISIIVIFFFIPTQIRLPARANNIFTNRTFPQFTMSVVFIASTCGFFSSLFKYYKLKKSTEERSDDASSDFASELYPFLGAAIILIYAFSFKYLSGILSGYGFIISTAIFIPAFLLLMKCRKWQYYLATYTFAAAMYLIFRFILKVMFR